MPQDRDDLSPAGSMPAPTAGDFDEAFSAAAASPGIRRVWELAAPDLPPQVEPFSFVSAACCATWRRPWTCRQGRRWSIWDAVVAAPGCGSRGRRMFRWWAWIAHPSG